ncbi:hypothetical protein JTE90_020874 [Oedothorax gibbosus]|uniref:C2H2-type domain-containing protein n=1 Tax=Oedothorax gibbosus TaxID=931172 RepID=A0AAV6US78_9ARAC|nr:hypothetical protein JTE90_020874 [Oedothorax gibbosus]
MPILQETGITFENSVECPVTAEESGDPEILCHFCAFAFSASLMDEHLKEFHQKELTSRKNRQTKKNMKGDIYLTDSNTSSTKPEKHREDFDERIDIETSKVTPPMQMGKNTLLHNSSLQSLPDNSFAPVEVIFCNLCNIKLLSGAEFESHMTSCHSKLDDNEIYQSAGSNNVCAQPTQNLTFSSLMSEDLDAAVYSSLGSNNQQSKDAVSQTTNKSLKVKRQLKCPTKPCEYCGKILTDKYMKTHFQKIHKEIYKTLYSGSNQENNSLEMKNTNSDIQSVSTLLQEDIACLSPSDALNVGERFGIVALEHVSPSDSSIKTENTNVNPLSKSKSKFKSINKSLQLTLKENASLKSNESKDAMESAQSKNYRCRVCFRIYTTKLFLTRHLLNFHKISTNTSNESSTVGQEPSLINQFNSTFSDIEQNGKSIVQNNYEISANEISGLHASNNSKKISNGSRHVDQVETASFEQVSFNNSTCATHSINELSESNMTNPNLNPGGNPTKVANVKKPRPKIFKCSMCPKAFSYSKLLENHKAKLHPNSLFVEHNKSEPQNCESTFLISNQQMDKTGISQNMDQLLVEQTLQHHESATHKNESYFNMPITTENTLNNNYSSSNLSDKVSLSKSDSFFHSSVCSSDDFIYEKNFCDNAEQKDSGSYSKQNSIETFNVNPSSSSIHFPSSYSTYSKNVEQGTDEQNDMNHAQMNFNENENVPCKSTLFTEMLRDSEDTSLPYQTSSCNSTMLSLPHAVYQQSTINLEASSVSTESNECPVCFKKMSTQDQLRHHIEKLHPSSALESTVQEDDKQIDSKFNSMFTELQQAYSVINSTESCENEPVEVEENNFELSYQKKDTQELSFTPGMTSSPLKKEEKQEQILTAFCNNFGNSTGPSSQKSLQQNEREESERNFSSPTIHKTEPLEVQRNMESAVREVSSSAPLAGQDTNNLDPIVLTDNSSALKHAWMFSDLLEEFEAQTGPTSEQNKAENENCEALSLKNNVNIQVNFQATTITGSSLMDNYLTPKPEILSELDTLNESSKLNAEINNDFNLASGDAFLYKGSHSVSMNDIFSDKFLGTPSDFTPKQVISPSEQGEASDHLFSSNIKYASCELDNQNNCEVEAEKMGQLFESEEIAKQISFLLNSGNESPNRDLMNITAAVSPRKDNFLPNAEESSFLNHSADQGMILTGSENPPTEFSITKPPTAAPKKTNFQPKKKHKCEICSKEYGETRYLTRHMKSVHSGIPKFSKTTVQKSSKINIATLDIKKDPGILSPSARSELVTLQPNSNNNVICTATVKTSNMMPVISISGKTLTCKLIPDPSMNTLPKRKSCRRNPCICPECPRMLCSSDSLRRHMRNLHPGCPLPTFGKVLRPSTSIPAPVMQNLTESGNLIEKQKLNTFNNSASQPIDKATVKPSVSFQTFPVSSTNLFGDDIDIAKNISLNEPKDSFNKKASIGTVCKDFKTSTVSDYVERTISTIANEIRLESLNKCARNIVKDQKSGSINSKSINEIANTNAFPLPSNDNKHRLQLSINNNNLRTFQSNSQILLIKCPSDVRFSERPNETVRTLSDFTNNKVKSEALVTLHDNEYQPNQNSVEHQTKIDPELMSSEKNVQNGSVNSIKTNFSSRVQVIGLGTTGQTLSQKKKPKKFPAPKVPAKVKRFPKSKIKVSSDFLKNSEKCNFCHKVFRSIATLSYHLKVIHKSKFTAASDTKCVDKSSPNLSQDTSIQPASVCCSNSQTSDTKNSNGSFSASSPTPEVGNDQKADIELANMKIELDNEAQTKSQFHEEDDSIAKRRSRRNDECEIVFEKPGTSSFLSTKCLPKKLNCISRKKYRNYKYSGLIKSKIKLSPNQKGPEEVNIASPVKNSSIPKCVIKVSNDGKYKIDKSLNYIKTGKAKFQFSKRRFCNGIVKVKQRCAHVHKRKLFTGLPINIRGRRPLKSINLSSIANSKIKKNRISIKNAAKQCSKIAKKSVPRQIKSYKKNCRNLKNSSTETFRDSKEIKSMDPEEKKRIANEKRIKAVQEWKRNRSQRSNIKAVHHTFDAPVKVNDSNKLKLFNSDDEEDTNELNFEIRPQFEGQSGQHLLEKSSQFSNRFKLDERFKIDDENPVEIEEENDEKTKNFKILESILGYGVSEKFPKGKCGLRKRQILRFDPEDENASTLIKESEHLEEKPKKKIREKKEKLEDKEIPKEHIPSSTERYIEVSKNLKEILKSASSSSFSLTSKFSSNVNDVASKKVDDNFASPFTAVKEYSKIESRNKINERRYTAPQKTINTFETQKKFTFFISENDERLKEGVNFFKRQKPLEETCADWEKNKQDVLDLLRKRRKISQRGYVTRPNASKKHKMFSKNKKV